MTKLASRAPNILFLFPDQHRPDWLKCATPDLPLRTPHIDALADRGVRFTQALCSSPLCAPSRACVASGRRYDRCGVPGNAVNYPLDQPTYYQSLRAAGYRVAGVGKFDLHKGLGDAQNLWWELDGSRDLDAWGFTEGIDNEGKFDGSGSYRRLGEPRGPYLAMLKERGLADAYVQEHVDVKQNMGAYTTVLPDDAYCDNWVAENGMRFLRDFPQDQPWHLVVNFTGPHNPMDVTASMRERWKDVDFPEPHGNEAESDREGLLRNRQNYAAMIENIDRHVGRFVAEVEARGELDNTIVVYASDHGEMLGDHGHWGKSTWRQASVGVPLIIAGPGVQSGDPGPQSKNPRAKDSHASQTKTGAAQTGAAQTGTARTGAAQNGAAQTGVVTDVPVVLHDLTASFLDWGAAAPLPDMDGRSLRPLLEGETTGHRDFAVSGLHDFRLVDDGRYKLVVHRDGTEALFDRQVDPWEDDDICQSEPATVDRLRAALRSEIGDWPPA